MQYHLQIFVLFKTESVSPRQLDEAVAIVLLGWTHAEVPADAEGNNRGRVLTKDGRIPEGFDMPPLGSIERLAFVPEYSRDLGHALRLASQVAHRELTTSIRYTPPQAAEAIVRELLHQKGLLP